MTETPTKPPMTHTAWIQKTEAIRKGRRYGPWIPEGVARQEADGSMHVYLHSLPIGGWHGHIWLGKHGAEPPDGVSAPQRPDGTGDDGQDSED